MKEKRKTLDNKDKNLKFKKISKKQKLQELGITLIALVVTIIILLILAGVTLNIALSDGGLFNKTKKATEDYKEAQSEEEESIRQISTQLYSEYVGAKVEGYSPADNESGVKIEKTTSGLDSNTDTEGNKIAGVADDGSQTFIAEEMSWRVWDYDGNTLRIIGDPTTAKLTLKGAAGYNNGVWAIDNICKTLYSNEAKGAIATNLKRTDIQKVSTYDYTQYSHQDGKWESDTTSSGDDENLIYFGESRAYTNGNNKYPKMWNENDKNWTYEYKEGKITGQDKECKKWEVIGDGNMGDTVNDGTDSTKFKQSYYWHGYNEDEFINDAYYDLIFKTSSGEDTGFYWLEGRYTHLYQDICTFGLQFIFSWDTNKICSGAECVPGNDSYLGKIGLRPVIDIDLLSSGFTMESNVDANGKMSVTLKNKNA